MDIKQIVLEYFNIFSRKEIDKLEQLFANDIYLRDWEVEAIGISNVIKANQDIFDSAKTLEVEPINIYKDMNTLICELIITIDSSEIELVVDIIEFDESGKIKSIKAYKGN